MTDTHELARSDAAAGPAAEPAARADRSPARVSGWWVVAATAAVVGVPLAIALVALTSPPWYPSLDWAMTALRVRDVPTADRPLVGLAGRLTGHGVQGSHPGPLSFYALWPVFRLLGGSGWALLAATATLNTAAVGAALWIARRRAGAAGLVGLAAGLAVLLHGYGIERLTEPWNPYLPLLWWIVFLLAAWSVLCDDLPLLPLAVFAGSLCAQTHVPYLGSVGCLLAVLTAAVALRARRATGPDRRRALRWAGLGAAVLVVLWLPPVIDEVTGSPGNLTIIRESFVHPPGPELGLTSATLDVWLSLLDVSQLARHTPSFEEAPIGSSLVGGAVLALWAAAAVAAWRRRRSEPVLWRLHMVVALALVLGLASVSRIYGSVYAYLLLGGWGTALLVVLATGWTAAVLWSRAPAGRRPRWAPTAAVAVLAAAGLVSSATLVASAARAEPPDPPESRLLAGVMPDTVDALDRPGVPGGGRDGRYLVLWSDAVSILPAGYGALFELERAGFDVGAPGTVDVNVVPHRVLDVDDATGIVAVVRGIDRLALVRSLPAEAGVEEVAYFEPRTPAQAARSDRLRARVVAELEAAGRDDLVAVFRQRMMRAVYRDDFPADLRPVVDELVRLSEPTAVFVGPPDESWVPDDLP
jgi:hypothetical protein